MTIWRIRVAWPGRRRLTIGFGPIGRRRSSRALPVARSFSASAVRAVVAGRLRDVFGEAFLRASCHVRTPNLPATQMMQLGHIPAFDPQGGPWGRGYLRVEVPIEPDAWFFEGHFKNDRCMPGTVMFDGCLQAMAFFMMACGHTLDRDGWRFVPVPEQEMRLRCRGQVRPTVAAADPRGLRRQLRRRAGTDAGRGRARHG